MTTDEKVQALTNWVEQLERQQAARKRLHFLVVVGVICLVVVPILLVHQQNREIVSVRAEVNALRESSAANRDSDRDDTRRAIADLGRSLEAQIESRSEFLRSSLNEGLGQLDSRIDNLRWELIRDKEKERARLNDTRPFFSNYDELRDSKTPAPLGDRGATGLVFSPDSRSLFAFHADTISRWDVQKRERVASWQVAAKTITAIDLTADGKTLAVACNGGKVVLYDVATRKEKRTLADPDKADPVQVQFNDDGSLLAVAGDRVHVWALQTDAETPRVSVEAGLAKTEQWRSPMSFVPGQQLLLTQHRPNGWPCTVDVRNGRITDLSLEGLGDGTLVSRDGVLWRIGYSYWLDGKRVESEYRGQNSFQRPWLSVGSVRYYTFCPKARFLIGGCKRSLSDDTKGDTHGMLLAWELSREPSKIVLKERLMIDKWPTKEPPNAAAFSPDGSLLAVATASAIVLWDAKALLPVTDPVYVAEDLRDEVRSLREQSRALEKRLKEVESRK